jgi:hypothetical protein
LTDVAWDEDWFVADASYAYRYPTHHVQQADARTVS